MSTTKTTNDYLSMAPADCLAGAKAMYDEIIEQDNRLWVLADKVRSELKSLQGEDGSSVVALASGNALSLAELLCDLMNDCHDKYRLQDCLDALQTHYGSNVSKVAA